MPKQATRLEFWEQANKPLFNWRKTSVTPIKVKQIEIAGNMTTEVKPNIPTDLLEKDIILGKKLEV